MTRFLIALFLLVATFPFASFADGYQFDRPDVNHPWQDRWTALQVPMVPFSPGSLRNPNDWKRTYEYVIWINKAAKGRTAQSLHIYRYGQLVLSTRVSTGREIWEVQGDPKKHRPNKSYHSSTGVGYFTPYDLKVMHKSKLWEVFMPYAIFFDDGIAIHQAPRGLESRLGTRASGGCVRVGPDVAPTIFSMVQSAGQGTVARFRQSGTPILDQNGRQSYRQNYRTLIIVEDRRD